MEDWAFAICRVKKKIFACTYFRKRISVSQPPEFVFSKEGKQIIDDNLKSIIVIDLKMTVFLNADINEMS